MLKSRWMSMLQRIETKSTSITNIESGFSKEQALKHWKARVATRNKKQQFFLIQAARQKVTELMSLMESEKSQGMSWTEYIVVETTGAAQACVELLRRKNLGVATFMILDERMKLAFFAALGNTVVAKDIDQDYAALYGNNKDQFFLNGRIKLIPQATRIAYGGNKEFRRVVTLEGALFEKSGTMSGGGGKPRGVRIYQASEKAVARLGMELTKIHKEALELQSKIENAGGERLKLQKSKVNKIQFDIDKSNTEINRHKLIDQHKDVLDKAKSDYEKLKKTVDELRASEVDVDYKLQDMKKLYKELEMKGKGYKRKLDELQVALVKHMEQIQKDLVDPEKLQATLADKTLTEDCGLKRALEMVALIEAQLKEMNPNLDSISEYRRKVSVYNERVQDLNMVTQERDDVKKQYDEWKKRRLVNFTLMDEFMAGFHTISLKLKEMYQMITLGGDAELELVDSLDPFSEGVVFSVRPPKKSWKNIANLSGGEKTLSSLALVFALHHYKPTPLYVMDEIDAALDFKNVSIVGHYVKDRTKDAQFNNHKP
ncbi:Structural maintenance of chromosomes protein 4 [Vitis vinifera]|uniref:Structural maintenance of chromosomes protein 4 n=1 Tax=Vitis vinifera TaxID=29760 RepID=A0A438HE07_VITVI|nr:Structural maintenance of chromosomes protein 4 [Vitis vinifera]